MVPSCAMLTGIAEHNQLWEQDVGGSNPLAPTKISAHARAYPPTRWLFSNEKVLCLEGFQYRFSQ